MRPFVYERAADDRAALAAAAGQAGTPPTAAPAQFIAGGTQLLDLMKLDTMQPVKLSTNRPNCWACLTPAAR